MIGWCITWVAKGYEASNETIEVAEDIIGAIIKFRIHLQQLYPDLPHTILSVRIIQ